VGEALCAYMLLALATVWLTPPDQRKERHVAPRAVRPCGRRGCRVHRRPSLV